MQSKLLLLLTSIACMTAANAQAVLLGGYDGTNAIGSPKQDAAAVGNFSFDASFSGTVINNKFNPGAFYNGGALWGTTSFTTAADGSNNSNFLLVDVHPVTLTFVVANTGTEDITLNALHWNAKRDRGTSPTEATITYTAGNLADTVGDSAVQTMGTAAGGSDAGYDFALSSILTDRTLAAGESATFTWVTNDMDDRLRLDNFAFSGEIVSSGPDTNPPTPSPMTWASDPTADGDSSISMTATTATDPSGVEYYFRNLTIIDESHDSGWQDSTEYIDTGLDPETEYTYTVTARDKSTAQNTTDSSAQASATTHAVPFGLVFNVNIDYQNQSRTGLVGPAGGAGETWAQSITGTHGQQPWTAASIPDSDGNVTGVSYSIGPNPLFRQNQTATNEVMQSALFWSSGNATTLTITGLAPSSRFDVYIAGFSSGFPTSVNWTTSNTTWTVGTQNYANTTESANWVQRDNYVLFENVEVDASGNIVMEGVKASSYAFISGFQLVQVPEPKFGITTFSPVAADTWELTLEADPDTLYEFRSSPDLSFSPGDLIENLTQGNPGTDPGMIAGTNNGYVTTDGDGLAIVQVTLAGSKNFVRAQEPGPMDLLTAVRAGLPRTVVIAGTSLSTAAYGDWPALMETWLKSEAPDPDKVTVVNLAVSGSNSQTGGINRLPNIKAENPDTVFMEFSMNDAYTPYAISQAQSQTNHNFIINDLLTYNPDMEIIVQTMNYPNPPGEPRPDIAAYYQVARDVATAQGLLLIDHYPNWLDLFNADPTTWSSYMQDGVHPNSTGYTNVLMPELQSALEP